MRFGMPVMTELADLGATVDVCVELGLDFVEFNMDLPGFAPWDLPASVVRKTAEEAHVGFTAHLSEELDLASFNPLLRKVHVQVVQDAMAWAAEAGVTLLNLHLNPGVYFSLPDRKAWIYEQHQEAFLGNLSESFRCILREARRQGIRVCVENCNFHRPHIEAAIDRLAELDGFHLTWDTGHDAGNQFRETPVLDRHRSRIVHVHLHDCTSAGSHQVLFTGTVDVAAALAFARERDLSVVIETKTVAALRESLDRLRERGLFPAEGLGVAGSNPDECAENRLEHGEKFLRKIAKARREIREGKSASLNDLSD